MAVEFTIFTFTNRKSSISIHLQVDNLTALSYKIKKGGTHNKHLLGISKKIMRYLLYEQNAITVEYTSIKLNMKADCEPQNVERKTERSLSPKFFCKISKILGEPKKD